MTILLQLDIVILPNQSNQDEQTGETLLVTKNESWKSISSLLDRNLIISESDVTNAFFVIECEEKKKI